MGGAWSNYADMGYHVTHFLSIGMRRKIMACKMVNFEKWWILWKILKKINI